jgi:5,6-dimethylbenzimidazole synthase
MRPLWPAHFCEELLKLMGARRDVRHFRPDPLPSGLLSELLEAACLAPSVGLSEPWRFVSVGSANARAGVLREFETQNAIGSLNDSGEVDLDYVRLKLAGLREAPVQLAVFCTPDPLQGRKLGRRTMPETVEYSVVAAIQNFWLMARARGIGVGWVSILRPEAVNELLDLPTHWRLVAYLCVGHPKHHSEIPELELAGWEHRRHLSHKWLER